jgi:transposase
MHADLNAACNIRKRFAVLRGGGLLSTSPEASSGGKLTAKTRQ